MPEAQALAASLRVLATKLGGTTSAEPLLGEKPEIAALAKDNQDTRLRFQQGTAQTRAQARLNSLSGDKL